MNEPLVIAPSLVLKYVDHGASTEKLKGWLRILGVFVARIKLSRTHKGVRQPRAIALVRLRYDTPENRKAAIERVNKAEPYEGTNKLRAEEFFKPGSAPAGPQNSFAQRLAWARADFEATSHAPVISAEV